MIRSTVFGLSLLFCFATTSFAETPTDPLPDYAEQFIKVDALLRNLDSTTHITNAYAWMSQAIEAKEELDAEKELKPWLTELAENFPDNWRVQCFVAEGFRQITSLDWKERQWNRIQRMDRAYTLLMKDDETSAEEKFDFYYEYIFTLYPYYGAESYYLLLKTPGAPYEDWSKQYVELKEYYATNVLERLHFFDLPTSYSDAENDGERLRQLIREQSELDNDRELLTMADYAALFAGVHINMPHHENDFTEEYEPAPYAREIAFNLADDETVVWGENTNDYRIVQLPKDYQYIPAFEQLAEQGDLQAAEKLGIIFSNRSQMERSAYWFETAGITNEVREIRANQGILLPHRSFMYEDPVEVDYYFRNGS
ncbi:MAG: hypothetical protein JXR40_07395, partial [Pontiellaceae bacterium]|nr:hypothetical protein [Pontiellaceae bacterium]